MLIERSESIVRPIELFSFLKITTLNMIHKRAYTYLTNYVKISTLFYHYNGNNYIRHNHM